MRVAHVITRMIVGGAQENTLFNCQDLIQLHGDDVLLITGPSLGPEGDLLQRGRGDVVPLVRIPALRRPIHPWRDWSSYRTLRQTIGDFQADVVHTHSAKGGILGRIVAHQLQVPAIIHTVHGAPFHEFQHAVARKFFRYCETFAAGRCDLLVSVADAMTDQLVAAGVAPRDKFETVYSGMEVEPFLRADNHRSEVRERLGFTDEHIVFGKIARLFHLKGHRYLIEAARDAVRRVPQIRFLFVGDGLLRSQAEKQVADTGLQQYFHFTGLVDPETIPELIGAMDALVHCSLREGLARTLPQALIAGKPVVSYDVDGAREVVLPEETGFLLPPKSVQPLSDAIVALADNADMRSRFGAAGRKRFTEQFRHENMTARLRELYCRVLDSRGR